MFRQVRLGIGERVEQGGGVVVAECLVDPVRGVLGGGVEAWQAGDLAGEPAQPGGVPAGPLRDSALATASSPA
ncbi:hypothetical protein AB0H36_11850 [Kribbella sp. NPDC050820]|uniref:hypothetical protein n=1 Tax=Kribbella sp. NPDC050820 TaxID=3155408 RepID=UPI0033D69331